jgi:hypothetical protein
MRLVRSLSAALLLAGVMGCSNGSADVISVTGTVMLDGGPLPDATVRFYPEGATPGLGGSGRTGSDGKYTLSAARGGGGSPAGSYKVVISRSLRPDGSLPDPKAPPIESDARETLSPIYSNRDASKLTATVSRDAQVHDFLLQTPNKRK